MISVFNDDIIQSLVDTDFYKLTMMQAVLHNYPNADVSWQFKTRTEEDLTIYKEEILNKLKDFQKLTITESQLVFLKQFDFIKPDFLRFLKLFRFDLRYIEVSIKNNQLAIKIEGPWLHVILFEVPLLALISQIRNQHLYPHINMNHVVEKLEEDLEGFKQAASDQELEDFKLSDFGTRRRFSYLTQKKVVEILQEKFPGQFVGTSNVHLAHLTNTKPLGTMAHEWIMAHQQLGPRLIDSQKVALEAWVKEYRGQLGIALTDCINMDVFLRDFDLYFAKLFDGLRHDSGDPILWGQKVIACYNKLGINPKTKTLIFSDSLTLEKSLNIYRKLYKDINLSFGIGTNLTNNIKGVNPLNIVIKMTHCNGQPVAKISDEPAKTQGGDPEFIQYLKHVFRIHTK